MFTGQPPTIRPSRRGRWRGVTAPEIKICLFVTESTKTFTATLIAHLMRFANQF